MEEYDKMVKACIRSTNKILTDQPNSEFQSMVTSADGVVAFDSSKCVFGEDGKIISRGDNTFKNFMDGTINVNHNTRPEMLGALLGTATNSQYTCLRVSSTSNKFTSYLAVRQGPSSSVPINLVRISFPRYVEVTK